MALLRPGRCGSRPQGGCLQHRTDAQRRPKGEDAGGKPALPGDAVPAVRSGVGAGRLLRMPTCTLWETPVCPRARPPPCRADHSRKNSRSLMKMNHEWTPRNTKRHEDRWTSFNHKRRQNASAILCPWCDFVSLALFHGLTPTAPCRRRIRGLIRTPGLAPGDNCFENRSPHAMSGLLESGSAVVGVAHPTKCLLQDFLPVKGIRPVAG